MPKYSLRINGKLRVVTAEADTPLLWLLRDELNLTGTKYGCGVGVCGACTVHENGNAVRAGQIAVTAARQTRVTSRLKGFLLPACIPAREHGWKRT